MLKAVEKYQIGNSQAARADGEVLVSVFQRKKLYGFLTFTTSPSSIHTKARLKDVRCNKHIHPLNFNNHALPGCCILIFCGLSNNQLSAQAAQDIVYLTSGLWHQGIVIEQKPGEYIRLLRLPERDTLQFSMDAIDRIVKIVAPTNSSLPENAVKPVSLFNQNRYVAMLNFYIGGGKYSLGGIGMSVGRSFNDRWQAGIGIQYIQQTNSNIFPNQQIIPITADFKFNIRSRRKAVCTLLRPERRVQRQHRRRAIRQRTGGADIPAIAADGVFFNRLDCFSGQRPAQRRIDVPDWVTEPSSGKYYNVESGELMNLIEPGITSRHAVPYFSENG